MVRRVDATWGEYGGLAYSREPTSELRGWAAPKLYPALEVVAVGFRKHVVENVDVRRDGPTFLDVELEPL